MKAVLLAAGFATRLYPLTRDVAKPLLDVKGRPVVSWILDRVLEVEAIDEVVVVTNARFADQFDAWVADLDVRVPISVVSDGTRDDAEKLGAIADMALAIAQLDSASPVLVIAGDNLIEGSLKQYVAEFTGEPMMLVRRIAGVVPSGRYGEILTDADGCITRFREKPREPESDLAATCLYLLPPGIQAALTEYLASGRTHDAPGNFIAWLAARRRVRAVELQGRLLDIGNLESLEEARRTFEPR